MTAGFIAQMFIILIFAGLLIYGYTKEDELMDWEQRTKIKLFRYIYNRIVAYENWRDMKKAGVKPQDVTSALFEDAYHYYDGYKTVKNLIGNEDHELVAGARNKCFACFRVINDSGLGDMFLEFVENKQKNNRVGGN